MLSDGVERCVVTCEVSGRVLIGVGRGTEREVALVEWQLVVSIDDGDDSIFERKKLIAAKD